MQISTMRAFLDAEYSRHTRAIKAIEQQLIEEFKIAEIGDSFVFEENICTIKEIYTKRIEYLLDEPDPDLIIWYGISMPQWIPDYDPDLLVTWSQRTLKRFRALALAENSQEVN